MDSEVIFSASPGNAVLDGSQGFQAGPTFQCRMMHQSPETKMLDVGNSLLGQPRG